jgi:hypothetical protein
MERSKLGRYVLSHPAPVAFGPASNMGMLTASTTDDVSSSYI